MTRATINPLLRFLSLGPGQHFLFRGNDGELFWVRSAEVLERLASAQRLWVDRDPPVVSATEIGELAAAVGLPPERVRELLCTEDLPPWLDNEFADPDFLSAIAGHMRLFFVFPPYSCNLACAYCTYGGLYPKERGHSGVKLDRAGIAAVIEWLRAGAAAIRRSAAAVYPGQHHCAGAPAAIPRQRNAAGTPGAGPGHKRPFADPGGSGHPDGLLAPSSRWCRWQVA